MSSVFKIRNKDGLFSTGGKYPTFTSRGKSWSRLSHIKSHLKVVAERGFDPFQWTYKDCEVVEYDIVFYKKYPVSTI